MGITLWPRGGFLIVLDPSLLNPEMTSLMGHRAAQLFCFEALNVGHSFTLVCVWVFTVVFDCMDYQRYFCSPLDSRSKPVNFFEISFFFIPRQGGVWKHVAG